MKPLPDLEGVKRDLEELLRQSQQQLKLPFAPRRRARAIISTIAMGAVLATGAVAYWKATDELRKYFNTPAVQQITSSQPIITQTPITQTPQPLATPPTPTIAEPTKTPTPILSKEKQYEERKRAEEQAREADEQLRNIKLVKSTKSALAQILEDGTVTKEEHEELQRRLGALPQHAPVGLLETLKNEMQTTRNTLVQQIKKYDTDMRQSAFELVEKARQLVINERYTSSDNALYEAKAKYQDIAKQDSFLRLEKAVNLVRSYIEQLREITKLTSGSCWKDERPTYHRPELSRSEAQRRVLSLHKEISAQLGSYPELFAFKKRVEDFKYIEYELVEDFGAYPTRLLGKYEDSRVTLTSECNYSIPYYFKSHLDPLDPHEESSPASALVENICFARTPATFRQTLVHPLSGTSKDIWWAHYHTPTGRIIIPSDTWKNPMHDSMWRGVSRIFKEP